MNAENIILAARLVENWKESVTQRYLIHYDLTKKMDFPATFTIINPNNQTYVKKKEPQLIAYIG